MLAYACQESIAIGAFTAYNIESLQAVLTASDFKHPVIISFGASYDQHMPLEAFAALVLHYCKDSVQPVVLHLDHCRQEKTIYRAIKAGFTSVMYDGSSTSFEENCKRTKEIVQFAHNVNVSVEGELGYMNAEDGTSSAEFISPDMYTTPMDAATYAAITQVDALAIAIGNVHGIYKGKAILDFKRLQAINKAAHIPLVLHGSSGISKEMLQKAIKLGIRKININTEISITGIRKARDFLACHQGV